jgi:hypothetical protein
MRRVFYLSEEIEVEFRPVKKIIIFEALKLSREDFFQRLSLIIMSEHPQALRWVDGLLLLMFPYYPECDAIFEDTKKGIMYWSSVLYTPMPEYKPIHKMGGIEVPIINQTTSPIIRRIVQELKKREEKQTHPFIKQ